MRLILALYQLQLITYFIDLVIKLKAKKHSHFRNSTFLSLQPKHLVIHWCFISWKGLESWWRDQSGVLPGGERTKRKAPHGAWWFLKSTILRFEKGGKSRTSERQSHHQGWDRSVRTSEGWSQTQPKGDGVWNPPPLIPPNLDWEFQGQSGTHLQRLWRATELGPEGPDTDKLRKANQLNIVLVDKEGC